MKNPCLLFFLFLLAFCSTDDQKQLQLADADKQKLLPLHREMGEVRGGEWLAYHEEKFISFEAYKKHQPVRPTSEKNKIYVLPIGHFDQDEKKVLQYTADYLKDFYGLEVKQLKAVSDRVIPADHRRPGCYVNYTVDADGKLTALPDSIIEQLHTKYILNEILKPVLPKDAAVMIALCDKDLYPEPSWNFVFGQAQLKDRVGVWSFFRFGDVHNKEEFPRLLKRTFKTASHETGHMFSLKHCARYKCIMNGSNHLEEADGKPTYFCPDCLEKFCWNMNQAPNEQFGRMEKFWEQLGDTNEATTYRAFSDALKK